jgi:hypothetical protein
VTKAVPHQKKYRFCSISVLSKGSLTKFSPLLIQRPILHFLGDGWNRSFFGLARIQGIRIHAYDAALHVSCCNSVFHAARCFPMKNSCSILVFHPSCILLRYHECFTHFTPESAGYCWQWRPKLLNDQLDRRSTAPE